MAKSDSTIGVGVALLVMTVGGMLVYTSLKGKSVTSVLSGDVGATLDPSGGVPTDPPDTAVTGTQLDPSDPNAHAPGATGTGGLPGVTAGTTLIDGFQVANWLASWVICARKNGWTGTVTSGYRDDNDQAQACIHVCGNAAGCPGTCAAPGSSNHRLKVYPGGAVDVTDPVGFTATLKKCTGPFTRPRNALPNDLGHFSATGH